MHIIYRSNLENCSAVWNPHNLNRIQQLERVQRKFTRHVWFKQRKPYDNYETRLASLQMFRLETRRVYFDLSSLYSIVYGNFSLSNKLVIRNNQYDSRRKLVFFPPKARTYFGRFIQPSMRLQYLYNDKVTNHEIIFLTKRKFSSNLKRELFV